MRRLCLLLLFIGLTLAPGVSSAQVTSTADSKVATLEVAIQGVLLALKNKDGKALAAWVDEVHGLRFIPYPWDEIEKTVLLRPQEVRRFFQDRSKKTWGTYDASGDPIRLSPSAYFNSFIWNVDYQRIADRERLPLVEHLKKYYEYRGTNEDVLLAFPQAWAFTVFNPGVTAPQGGAMDWSWLTVVFIPKGDTWVLAGIVHKEWTI